MKWGSASEVDMTGFAAWVVGKAWGAFRLRLLVASLCTRTSHNRDSIVLELGPASYTQLLHVVQWQALSEAVATLFMTNDKMTSAHTQPHTSWSACSFHHLAWL